MSSSPKWNSLLQASPESVSELKTEYRLRRRAERRIYNDQLQRKRRQIDFELAKSGFGQNGISGQLVSLLNLLEYPMKWVQQIWRTVMVGSADWSDPATLEAIKSVFDAEAYLALYPDVRSDGIEAWEHFIEFGITEFRNPNRYFDSTWYLQNNLDARNSRMPAIVHYVRFGAKELRNPGPKFNAREYVRKHPSAKDNPLSHFLSRGSGVEDISALSPKNTATIKSEQKSTGVVQRKSAGVTVIIPAYRGTAETRRCIESVLADTVQPPDHIIVVDDFSPERELSEFLDELAQGGAFNLIRNERNRGFVASVNIGMSAAGSDDVVLLNSDTEVPPGWLMRLERQAYSNELVGTVTPLSNNATICNYPNLNGGDLPPQYTLEAIDEAAQRANSGLSVEIPTAVGFAMFIKRSCLVDVGMFDEKTFGLGYGEENDFCLRAMEKGWTHLLALDTYVYHKGEVSFGKVSPSRDKALVRLLKKFPNYLQLIGEYGALDPARTHRFAVTAELFEGTGRPLVLLISHALGGGTQRHIEDLIEACSSQLNFLLLLPTDGGYELSVPRLEGHAKLRLSRLEEAELLGVLKLFNIARVHIHHVHGFDSKIESIVRKVGVPFDFTVHDYLMLCPRINLITSASGSYCGEASEADCNFCISTGSPPISPARNIFEHRWRHRWLIDDAERVICPSEDAKFRLQRYGFTREFTVVPHEENIRVNLNSGQQRDQSHPKLRIAILGGLGPHKGLQLVKETVAAARQENLEFTLIGASDPLMKLPRWAKFRETGRYDEVDLRSLISEVAPDLFWFPSICPETYNYTLSVALEEGKPIVATSIGAFPERLAGRQNSILLSPFAEPADWISAFLSLKAQWKSHTAQTGEI